MTVASIDIGTNTVLLLIAMVDERGGILPLAHQQRIPRLGKGVAASGNLHPDAVERTLAVLREYRTMIDAHHPESVVVCGTSAVREAGNRTDFIARVKEQTGFSVEILSGEEEAFWTYRGAVSGVPGIEKATVVDIGGGSTEITVGDRTTIGQRISLDVGCVRLTERFFRHDPPAHAELGKAIEVVEEELARARGFDFADSTLIGVAGTVTSLAILDQGLKRFDIQALINYSLRIDRIDGLFRSLRSMPSAEIRELSEVMEGRADVMTAGVLILREIMARFKFRTMIVSERGVRYGLALRAWERRAG